MRRQDKEILDQLERLIANSDLTSSPQMSAFLRYIVEAKLNGEEKHIKAYTVGVEALGKDESFDPQSDPVVRVLAARLRKAVELYYATDGQSDPVIIRLNKGSYIPAFEFKSDQEITQPEKATTNQHESANLEMPELVAQNSNKTGWFSSGHKNLPMVGASLALVAIAMAIYAIFIHYQELPPTSSNDVAIEPPIVEVLPFETHDNESDTVAIAETFRRQLIADLSHFRRLRVRDGGANNSSKPNLQKADYSINSYFMEKNNELSFTLGILDEASQSQVWSKSLKFDLADQKFNDIMLQSVRHIVAQLASISGLLHAEAMKRIENRASQKSHHAVSSYECMVKFHTFDLRKRRKDEIAARNCVDDLIEKNTRNASIWAAKALFMFFEWSKTEQATETMLNQALEYADTSIRLDPADSFGYEVKSYIVMNQGDYHTASETIHRARELNPSKPNLLNLDGRNTILKGEWEKGSTLIKEAIRISPAPPGWFRIPLVFDAFRAGDYREALSQAKEMIRVGDRRGYILAIVACSRLNNPKDTAKYIAQYEQNVKIGYAQSLGEFRKTFNITEVLDEYELILKSHGLI